MAIHVGDIGTALIVHVVDENGDDVDISTATTKTIYLTDPAGTTTAYAASLNTTGTDGRMKYVTVVGNPTTVPGTLNARGDWKIEGFVAMTAGSWSTDEGSFGVLPSSKFPDY